jgi:tRNA 2-thiouridine synthesizing protein A
LWVRFRTLFRRNQDLQYVGVAGIMEQQNYAIKKQLDATGLACPEPVMLLHKIMREVTLGDCVEVLATDPSTQRDIPKFCQFLNHELLWRGEVDGQYVFHLRKGK